MKKVALVLFIAFGSLLTSSTTQTKTYVYICTGSKSECYHKSDNCRGLSRCSGSVKKITKDEAIKLNRRYCKICYK